jgi:GNAT superfamily N-acetyltransferase/predicted nucleic acid-binding protein
MKNKPPIRLVVCKEDDPAMPGVIRLADANTERLGFVPGEALRRGAAAGEIVVALLPEHGVAGYTWCRVTRSTAEARIHHLCVAPEYRKRGVGQLLVNEVKTRTRHLQSIVLRCRRDFEDSCRFWRRVGFTPFGELPGRGKDASVLTCFRYDHHTVDLWSDHRQRLAEELAVAVLDANIFFDLVDEEREHHREAASLKADWIANDAAMWVTDELHNEIDRGSDPKVRRRQHGLAHAFNDLRVDEAAVRDALQKIKTILPLASSDADESDHRHLAIAVAGRADYFITRDGLLLDHGPTIAESLLLNVLSPLESTEFQPIVWPPVPPSA